MPAFINTESEPALNSMLEAFCYFEEDDQLRRESVSEWADLLRAVVKLGRIPTSHEIYDWKLGRGDIGFWPRRERETWLCRARLVISRFIVVTK